MTISTNAACLSRRMILRSAIGSAGAALLAACGGTAAPTVAPTAATVQRIATVPATPAMPAMPLPSASVSLMPAAATVPAMPTAPAVASTVTSVPVSPIGSPMVAVGSAGAVGGTAPPGSVAGTLAASAQACTASPVSPVSPAPPLPMGFVGATPVGTLAGVMPPADLAGRLSVQRLTFALPLVGDALATLMLFNDLLGYMAKALGIPVVGVVGASAADTVDAMRTHAVDAALLSPFAYLLAKQTAMVAALVQGEAGDGMPALSSTVLIGRRDGGPNTPAELRGKTVAFVTADPTFGQVMPAYLLATNPRLVEMRDYTVLPVPTWADAYAAVTMGRADAGALTTAFFQRGLEARTIDNDRVKVLDKSPDIAGPLVALRSDLPMSDSDVLTALLLTINEQPAMSRLIQSTIAPPPNGAGTFGETAVKLRKASDATYNPVRDVVMRFGVDLRALAR